MDIIGIFISFLESLANSPLEYAIVLFFYSIATAILLPIPVEVGLFLAPSLGILTKSLIVAAGKATGCIIVFYLGLKVERSIRLWSEHVFFVGWFVKFVEWFVSKTSYWGLYLLMSIPFMPDTITLYLYSVFNKDEIMTPNYFVIVNFLASINRCMIVIFLAEYLGIYVV
jgi:membrane protein YqaA with SNARE-associated domain